MDRLTPSRVDAVPRGALRCGLIGDAALAQATRQGLCCDKAPRTPASVRGASLFLACGRKTRPAGAPLTPAPFATERRRAERVNGAGGPHRSCPVALVVR